MKLKLPTMIVVKSFFNLHRKILFYLKKEKRQDANFIVV